ncbi:MAG: hypothetical protein H8D97_00540 [Proteobacteria bacterium]|nr:hypothetical protein [Pseudomonadota bacterium]
MEKNVVIIEEQDGSTKNWISIYQFAKMLYEYDNEIKFTIEELLLREI